MAASAAVPDGNAEGMSRAIASGTNPRRGDGAEILRGIANVLDPRTFPMRSGKVATSRWN